MVLQKTRKPINVTEKSRQDTQKNAHEQRFRVVNCMRTTLQDDAGVADDGEQQLNAMTKGKSKEITIVDIEKQSLENDKTAVAFNHSSTSANATKPEQQATTSAAAQTNLDTFSATSLASESAGQTNTDSDMGYVYDLYIPDGDQQADYVDLMDDNYLRLVLQLDMFMLTNCYI